MSRSVIWSISQIADHLYLCAAKCVDADAVKDLGVTCIVNATVELPNLPIKDVEYVKVAVDDSPYVNISEYFDRVADKILEVKNKGGKTLVHCIAGVSRSSSLCIAYLMKHEGMSLKQAYQYVKDKRPIIHPNNGFFKQLIEYERKLYDMESVKLVIAPTGATIPDVYESEYQNLVWFLPSNRTSCSKI